MARVFLFIHGVNSRHSGFPVRQIHSGPCFLGLVCSKMVTYLPWLLIVLGLVAVYLEKPTDAQRPNWLASALGGMALLVVVVGGMSQQLIQFTFGPEWIAVLLLIALAGWRPGAKVGAVALAGAIVSAGSGVVGAHDATLYLHLAILGAGVAGFLIGDSRSGAAAALTGFAGVSARYFLIEDPSPNLKMLPGAIMLLVVVLGIVQAILPRDKEVVKQWSGPVIGVFVGIGAFAVGAMLFPRDHMPRTMLVSAFAAAATAWAMPFGKAVEPLRIGLAGLVWLGIATFAFSNSLTLGLSLALIAGAGAMALSSSEAGYAMLAPLGGLIGHRLARNVYPDAVKAFDLGQHYALVGVILAVCLVLMVSQGYVRAKESQLPRVVGSAAVGWVLAVLVVLFSVMFLGAKGTTGLIVGIGLAPLLVQLSRTDGATGAALSVGFIGILGLAYPALTELFETSRAEKQSAFVVAAIVGLALAGFLVWLGRKPAEKTEIETV